MQKEITSNGRKSERGTLWINPSHQLLICLTVSKRGGMFTNSNKNGRKSERDNPTKSSIKVTLRESIAWLISL